MWNVTDWQKVVFSDESRFVLRTDDNRVQVWRRPGAIFQQDNARPHTARVDQDFLCHFQTLPWPPRSPYLSEARVGSAKTADAIVSLCTRLRVGWSRFMGLSASGQHKVYNQINAGPCGGMYGSWRWSNALLKLPSICIIAHPVFV
ncbi:uncharacterized protein TNCV_2835581 [Trichonephila clavipes]|uniref:Uncharacterized protein n=1 Tax=Trichonephila clavipes TaxID=2585209 RepID=A0A8X6S187_TRICX|nr:uncharacterized protein TNCV_2835581 [Trichonephila clavipes]